VGGGGNKEAMSDDELFKRNPSNPLFTASDMPFPFPAKPFVILRLAW
jgi:hypothetical protein